MIPKVNITAWQPNAPWATDAQVEQDLVISKALIEIFSDKLLAKNLAFRGGTALHKLFFHPAARYSEDIDLVQIEAAPIGPIFDRLRKILNPWLGTPRYKQSQGRATLVYRFESEIPPITPLKLKIEINTREHTHLLGLLKKPFSMESRWYSNNAEITTFYLEELLGTKLRALYQRKKGRDLYDLSCALKSFPELDIYKIIDCFKKYMAFEDNTVTGKEFEECLKLKLNDPTFQNDIKPLLALSSLEEYDIYAEGNKINRVFISQI